VKRSILPGPRSRMMLFAGAVFVPCLVLVGAGLYLVHQERELAEKRRSDDRRQAAVETREDLLARLEQIRQSAIRNRNTSGLAGHPSVVMVCVLHNSQVLLPWESEHGWKDAHRMQRNGEFGRLIAQGEREQFALGRLAAAANTYRRALEHARDMAQSAYGRLALGTALDMAGASVEAREAFEELLRIPPSVRDEFGVPFGVYAAERLLEDAPSETLSEYLRSALAEPGITPACLYILRRLANHLGNEREQQRIDMRIGRAERAEELKRTVPELRLWSDDDNGDEPIWIPHGEPPWLVTAAAPGDASENRIIAVGANALLKELAVPEARLLTRGTANSILLGDPLPGLWLQLPASYGPIADEEFQTRERYLWAALALVLVVTFFAGFLSWTDVRREVASARLRTEFVESVTHELKTPLSSIRMFAETLRHRTAANSRVQTDCVDTIIGESERLTRLVDNVLDFSKIEQGRKIYRTAPVELPRVIEAAVRAMRYPLERRQFSLDVTVGQNLPAISGDADSLEQAVLNLIGNAMKYSGEAREIRLLADREGEDAVIRVQDEGIGIEPEEQKRIFARFHRVPSRANQDTPGAGLGLTLVKHIVEAHGGAVTVESAPGKGSSFTIRLPIGGAA
jgi:signal transduction histidine kinase